MPRPSSDPEKAKQGGGVEAGLYEVTGAKYQNLKSDFKATQPHLLFTAAPLDKDGDRVRGADDVEIRFGMGEKSLAAFHPGQGSGPDDANPTDQGAEIDVEGNTIFCEGAEQFQKSCGYMVFLESLKKQGFPVAVLDQTWAPHFVGLKFELATLAAKECNEKFGTRLNTRPMKDDKGADRPITYKVAVRWINPNYLANGGKPAAAEAGKPEAPSAADTPEQLASKALAAVAAQKPGAKNTIKSAQALKGFITNAFTRAKMNPKHLAAVQALVTNADWVQNAVAELGGECGYDDAGAWNGTVTFPEAAAK